MKQISVLIILAMPVLCAQGQVSFNDYFVDKTMRVDFYMTGNIDEEIITIDQIYRGRRLGR